MRRTLHPAPARRRAAGGVLPLGLVVALSSTHPAHAQMSGGVLPPVGAGANVGDLRPQLESFLRPQTTTAARPAWLITPAIEADAAITDNAEHLQSPRRGDIYGILSPQIIVSGDTASVTANLAYAPQFTVYAKNSSQNQIIQNFNGQALVTAVPDAIFLDLRGAITQQSLTGGLNQYQTQSYNAQNSVQTTTLLISPYATHRFGGWGTGTIRYSFARTLEDTPNNNNQTTVNTDPAFAAYGQSGYGTLGNLSTSTETATFTTGENLGRYNISTSIDAVQYAGGASYQGAYRHEAQVELSYAVSHKFSLLAGIGYQEISYGGNPGYHLSGATYNVGFTYAPTPDTKLTVQYGRNDGDTNVNFSGEISPTGRTRLVARYTTGVTSDLQQAQTLLNTTTVGPTGARTDTATGAPVLNNNYNGLQNGVYRLNSFSATAIYLQDRNTFSLSIGNDKRTTLTTTPTLLNNGLVPAGTSSDTTSVTFIWQHDLAPDMSLTTSAQYGISTNTGQLIGSGNQNQTTLSFSAVLSKQFTETLNGTVRYTYTNQSGAQVFNTGGFANNGFNTGNYSENVLLVGLRKSF